MSKKTVIMCGDLHCGHRAGLTPAAWNYKTQKHPLREEMWRWFARKVDALPRPHLVVANGDLIDGRDEACGGRGLLSVDRLEQAQMATDCLKLFNAKNYAISYGTPYHSGKLENFEDAVAKDLGCKPSDHLFIDVNGVKFDVKHKVGSSGIPHGRRTAIEKANLWNMVWADKGMQDRCDVFVRSHVHYFGYSGDSERLAMTLPALQAAATQFGARQCEGYVDFGFIEFTISSKGDYSWTRHILKLKAVRAEAQKY